MVFDNKGLKRPLGEEATAYLSTDESLCDSFDAEPASLGISADVLPHPVNSNKLNAIEDSPDKIFFFL